MNYGPPPDPELWSRAFSRERVALVTGGAGAVGAAAAAGLAGQGARVVIADIDAERTDRVVSILKSALLPVEGFVADLTVAGAVEAAVEYCVSTFGPVEVLVNALGEHLALAKPFEESTEDEWDRLYRVNLLHTMRACRAALPAMKEAGWGRIINFSSVEGIRAMPLGAPYTAFKGGIDSFTKSLAVEVAPYGVRVNAIAVDKTRSYQVGFYEMPREYDRHVPIWIPAGHYAEGDDIAAVVLFLASELSEWIVGQTLVSDGGTLSAGGWYRTPARWTNSPLLVQYFEGDPGVNAVRPPGVR